jgi:N-acetylglucosaminyldiphosphoundecaprenol N-acetyl-beta-D-mannosaminyltransferase
MKTQNYDLNFKTVEVFGFSVFCDHLEAIPIESNLVINTINAHSYNNTLKDKVFKEALAASDILLPDGAGIVLAHRIIDKQPIHKIAGYDIFMHILKLSKTKKIKCFFLGSSPTTLTKIEYKLKTLFPNIDFAGYSPPFKDEFSAHENQEMRNAINAFKPDFLFVGMTAPKQEKWTYTNREYLDVKVICNIGAVFDFFAGNTKRAPKFLINNHLEWFHRSFTSRRLLKRYIVSNPVFLYHVMKAYFKTKTEGKT